MHAPLQISQPPAQQTQTVAQMSGKGHVRPQAEIAPAGSDLPSQIAPGVSYPPTHGAAVTAVSGYQTMGTTFQQTGVHQLPAASPVPQGHRFLHPVHQGLLASHPAPTSPIAAPVPSHFPRPLSTGTQPVSASAIHPVQMQTRVVSKPHNILAPQSIRYKPNGNLSVLGH